MADLTLELRSTGDLLRRSFISFFACFPSLLLASLLILLYRSALLAGAPGLAAISDRIRTINITSTTSAISERHNHDPPFLDLPVARKLDAAAAVDYFFLSPPTSSYNSSFPSSSLKPFKISVPASHSAPFYFYINPDAAESDGQDRAFDPRILDEQVLQMLYIIVHVSSFYILATLGFVLVFSSAFGIVFFAVAASHLRKPVSTINGFFSGALLGIRRLKALVYLRWVSTDTLSQSLSLLFSPDFHNQVDLFKFSLKIKLLTSLISLASSKLFPEVIPGFIYVSAVLDAAGEVIFAILRWVVVMGRNGRQPGRSVVKEGWYLVSLMPVQVVVVKALETIICKRWGRWVALKVGGRVLGGLIRSLAEVYFMVLWLVFYFVARSKDVRLEGRRFGLEDLEECINGIR
ncbi:uncharacterized protein [Typha angustifolia]|uniref:uncharacterized protein isoform X1 n=1 Tax=Typha angustifolia TaxID=59011 RepID=UPI003C2ED31B